MTPSLVLLSGHHSFAHLVFSDLQPKNEGPFRTHLRTLTVSGTPAQPMCSSSPYTSLKAFIPLHCIACVQRGKGTVVETILYWPIWNDKEINPNPLTLTRQPNVVLTWYWLSRKGLRLWGVRFAIVVVASSGHLEFTRESSGNCSSNAVCVCFILLPWCLTPFCFNF